MLSDNQLNKYADVLFWGLTTARKQPFRKKDIILIQYEPPALKLAEILYAKTLDRGMYPVQRMGVTYVMEHAFFQRSKNDQLVFITPGDKELFQKVNGRFFLRAPESLTHLKDIDPVRIGKVLISRKPLREILDRREEKGFYSWTLCTVPTEELARQAKTTIRKYTDQIVRACYLDKEDPVAEWEHIHRSARQIKKWLNSLKIKYLHIESAKVDLKIRPGSEGYGKGSPAIIFPASRSFFRRTGEGPKGSISPICLHFGAETILTMSG